MLPIGSVGIISCVHIGRVHQPSGAAPGCRCHNICAPERVRGGRQLSILRVVQQDLPRLQVVNDRVAALADSRHSSPNALMRGNRLRFHCGHDPLAMGRSRPESSGIGWKPRRVCVWRLFFNPLGPHVRRVDGKKQCPCTSSRAPLPDVTDIPSPRCRTHSVTPMPQAFRHSDAAGIPSPRCHRHSVTPCLTRGPVLGASFYSAPCAGAIADNRFSIDQRGHVVIACPSTRRPAQNRVLTVSPANGSAQAHPRVVCVALRQSIS